MSNNNKTMLIVNSTWQQQKTFNLIPISEESPYVECIFNPSAKVLAVIGKSKKNTFHMVPRLDDNGGQIRVKSAPDTYKQQRVEQETFSEYYITEKEDIKKFLELTTVNFTEFDWEAIYNMEAASVSNMEDMIKAEVEKAKEKQDKKEEKKK